MRESTPNANRWPVAEAAAVFVGGALGALARYGIVEVLGTAGGGWPWATFVANLVGCAILGYAIAHIDNGRGSDVTRSLIGTGFCGGLTTFSTFQLEVFELLDAGDVVLGAAYALASVAAGLLTISLARRFVGRGEEIA